ncbi:PH domain-containing protein [Leucobacter viscericola]|uniref:PH domain-containing protein n=1 Tax=Leucobacter viscericola TaxID=2714935 RepID=A0A6G7XH50_9MICO|nr:PH domain-containing protein [Leucobacter viscericola]QIK63934.1 PH domain-containing protein [Leucobacter viscericola]
MTSRDSRVPSADFDAALGPVPASFSRPEVVVVRFRRHGSRLVLPVLVLLVVAAVAGYWVGALPSAWMNIAAGAGAALLGLLFGIVPILTWLTRRTTVTTRRVIVRSGFFVRHRSEVMLARVREVKSSRSLAQRMRGSGDVVLLHGIERTVLSDVPGAEGVIDALQELSERNYEHSTNVVNPTLS